VVAVVGILMLRWSWMKWPDVLVDFGQQLYLPWQLAEGKHLYTDLSYFHGPLAQYVNALGFSFMGTSIWTVVNINLLVLAALFVALHLLLEQVSSSLGATVAGVVFMVMFAFAQLAGIGNYNYLAPYEHSATWGMLTSIAALWFLARFLNAGGLAQLAGSGVCLGLCFLTKAEIFLAAGAAVAIGLGLALWARPTERRRALRIVAILAGTSLIPIVVTLILLTFAMPPHEALLGTLGPWPAVIEGDVAGLRFYRGVMGTLDLGANLWKLLVWVGWYAALFVPAAAIALLVRKRGHPASLVAAACFVLVAGLLILILQRIPWSGVARPLPLAIGAAAVTQFIALAGARRGGTVSARALMRPTMLVFAFVLLFKMILNTRVAQYGFFLAMPATLLFVVAVVDWIPAWITRKGGRGPIFGAVALAVVAVTVIGHLRIMNRYYEGKTHRVASGHDAFWADVRGRPVKRALDAIATHVGPEQTLAVLPEGAMLNYLSRRVNPTPHNNFMPPSLLVFGEDNILQSFKDHPPDFVMLVHKDTTEFGSRFFGRNYGWWIAAWIEDNYERAELIGYPPLQDNRFGMLLMRRVEAPPESPGGLD
jgi:hypothetical protein